MKTIINFKLFLICLIFLAANNFLNSQPKSINYSNWLFGNKAGLSFNTLDSVPIEIFTNIDMLKSDEGISTYSDDDGNVKLVCNGQRLVHFYDINDLSKYIKFEFNNIFRKTSSTNSTIIIPSLSNPNQFYIFIVGENYNNKFYTELYYGVFDVSLNNDIGDFVLNLNKINSNVSEKLAVVYDYNYNWYWIATTTYKDFGNTKLLFYKLDKFGLNENPIEIETNSKCDIVGDMKFSNSGKYLVFCGYDSYNLDLYKFDFKNCTIENIFTLRNLNSKFYGTEFSKDDRKLFFTYFKLENKERFGYIDQFSLLGTSSDILESQSNIKKDSLFFGNIKIGLDNKLYIPTKEYLSVFNPNYDNNINNYLTVLDNVDLKEDKITDYKLIFNNNCYSLLGIQTIPVILNNSISKPNCTPDLSVYLNNNTVQLGDTFCVNGTFIPECEDSTILYKLEIYFEYDPKLMSFLSATSSTYSIVPKGDKYLLILPFNNGDFILNQANEFSFCFRSLLGNSLNPDISVFSDESTKESYNLIDYINSNIEYISCDQPFRQIELFTLTDFEAILNIRSLNINLSTQEQGLFKFIITNINGQIVKQQDYTTSKNEYNFEEIIQLDLSNLASGIYNIRMTSPSGKYYTKRIILVD